MISEYGLIIAGAAIAVVFAVWIYLRLRQGPKQQYSPFTQALTLMLAGENRKALEILREVVKEDTDNIEAYILYGDILRKLGQFKQAAKIHKELTVRERMKTDLRMTVLRSLLQDYIEGKMYQLALDCSDDLLSLGKDDLWTLNKRLGALEALGDWKRSSETARKIQNISGNQDRAQLSLYKVMEGRQLLEKGGREHDARLKFREGVKTDDRFAMPYLELADSYLREDRTEDALKEWKRLFAKNPHHAYLAFGQLEDTLFDLNRFEELENIYRKLIAKAPDNSRAVAGLAKFLHRKGETGEAIKLCQEGLEHRP
ncbi:MAG: tetratricopeptide repeat protein, partial [FCB group bacterium]|nr:tetratricopeptide repeat protein [FCB group bacterium]